MAIENDILTCLADSQAPAAERLAELMPPDSEVAELMVKCAPADFMASAIARAVEDCNAHLINMNVTSARHSDGSLMVHLRINLRNAGPVARSLERYGFEIIDSPTTASNADSTLADNANYLLRIIDL